MEKDTRSTLLEFWQAFLAMLLALVLLIVGIYVTQAYSYRKELKRLEMIAAQKEIDRRNRAAEIKIFTFVNTWEWNGFTNPPTRGAYQKREIERLEPGVEYEIGQRNCYDRNNEYGFDRSMPDANDEDLYFDPLFTFDYNGILHIYSSMAAEGSWMVGDETSQNPKTEVYHYLPLNPTGADDFMCCVHDEVYTVQVPLNGENGLNLNRSSLEVDSGMRYYNHIYEERLGDVYENVPEKYADRTRTVYTSSLIIESWQSDPCEWKSPNMPLKPEATVQLLIRNYGAFNVTAKEYESMIIDVPIFSNINHREFSPRTTVELVY